MSILYCCACYRPLREDEEVVPVMKVTKPGTIPFKAEGYIHLWCIKKEEN